MTSAMLHYTVKHYSEKANKCLQRAIFQYFQMSDIYEFPNDPEEQEEAKKEEAETLALSSSWIGIANSTKHPLKVETFVEYARVTETAGARKHFERNENNCVKKLFFQVGLLGVPLGLKSLASIQNFRFDSLSFMK